MYIYKTEILTVGTKWFSDKADAADIAMLDKLLNENTEGWDTTRVGKVELAVLRLGAYELRYDDDIPDGVAINEAVEIAKKYGQESSGGFVNAILAKIMKSGE